MATATMDKVTTTGGGSVALSFDNDSSGNRLQQQNADGSTTYYSWDAAGRMATVEPTAGIVTMVYNADGQRVAKESPGGVAGFFYDHKRLLNETDDVGGDITATYASGTSEEFGDLIGETGEYQHQYEAQANTNALLDDAGVVQAQYKYDAFGQVQAPSIEGGAWTLTNWDPSRQAGSGPNRRRHRWYESVILRIRTSSPHAKATKSDATDVQ